MPTQNVTVWSNKTGRRHTVAIYEPMRDASSMDGIGHFRGLARITLDDGRPLNRPAIGVFKDQWSDEEFSTSKPAEAVA